MQQHAAVTPAQAAQEAALAIFYRPALLTNTPLLRCQEIYLIPFGASPLLSLAKGVQKNPKPKLKWGRMKSTSFSVPREKVQTRSDLRKSPAKSLCSGK